MKIEPLTTTSASTAFLMAFVAGFTDVISFIGLNHLFTAHITGNIVIAISEVFYHQSGVLSKIVAIPLFIIFVILMALMIEKHGKTTKLLFAWLIAEAVLFVIFMFSSIYLLQDKGLHFDAFFVVGMIAVCAMAIHNTLLRTYMTQFPPCTVMTGNLTQFVIDLVTYCLNINRMNEHEKYKRALGGLKRYGNVLVGFLFGGLISAIGFSRIGFWILSMPIIILLVFISYIGMALIKNKTI